MTLTTSYKRGIETALAKYAKAVADVPHASETDARQDKPEGVGKKLLRGTVGAAGQVGLEEALIALLNATASPKSDRPLNPLRDMWRRHQMAEHMGLKTRPSREITYGNTPTLLGQKIDPSFFGQRQTIFGGKYPVIGGPWREDEAVQAHEMGHAKNHEQGTVGGVNLLLGAQIPGRLSSLFAVPLAAYAAGATRPSYTPAVIQAALGAPVLLDEGAASARATSYLVSKYGPLEGLRKALPLLPAFGTYANNALLPLAITAMRRRNEKPEVTP